LSQSAAAPPTAALAHSPEQFGRLLDGFRGRIEREIGGFLAGKRAGTRLSLGGVQAAAAAAGSVDPAATAPGGDAVRLGDPGDLVDGIARLMEQGGKRLRPAFVHFTYLACGGQGDQRVVPLALATEFLHTYLLIHDDIMDHADTRRGQPSAHARFRGLHRDSGLRGDGEDFGRSAAILLGDLAHTYAVELFTRAILPAPPAASAASAASAGVDAAAPRRDIAWGELSQCFSTMCEEVIGGQYLEFLLAHRDPADPATGSATEILRVLQLKSGRYTAERPIQLGALLAGAPPAVRDQLSRYGTAVGEAFQLQDDLLGVFGDPATTGKPVGDDLREGKFTLLVHHAIHAGTAADRAIVTSALGRADLDAAGVEQVQQVLERTGARRAIHRLITERLDDARRALDAMAAASARTAGAGPPSAAVADGLLFLTGLLEYLRERKQ
jgi:geranylgeranyl diphosphate synthase, type I